jgi:hypothetical protein
LIILMSELGSMSEVEPEEEVRTKSESVNGSQRFLKVRKRSSGRDDFDETQPERVAGDVSSNRLRCDVGASFLDGPDRLRKHRRQVHGGEVHFGGGLSRSQNRGRVK